MAMEILLSGAPPEKILEYFQQGDEIENTIQVYTESITFARLMWNPRYDVKLDHRLGRIRIPTLVVGADDDRLIPARHAERWAELIPARSAPWSRASRATDRPPADRPAARAARRDDHRAPGAVDE